MVERAIHGPVRERGSGVQVEDLSWTSDRTGERAPTCRAAGVRGT